MIKMHLRCLSNHFVRKYSELEVNIWHNGISRIFRIAPMEAPVRSTISIKPIQNGHKCVYQHLIDEFKTLVRPVF